MTLHQLSNELFDRYSNAEKGEQVTNIYLFGIKYHSEIKEYGVSAVIEESGLSKTYKTELTKAIKIGPHVQLL